MIDGARTRDNQNHNLALYQLNYDHHREGYFYRGALRKVKDKPVLGAVGDCFSLESLPYCPQSGPHPSKVISLKTLLLISLVLPLTSIAMQTSYKELKATILDEKCIRCHSAARPQAGVVLDSYERIMENVVAGSPEHSMLYEVVSGTGSVRMPPREPLSQSEIEYIRTWISDQAPQ